MNKILKAISLLTILVALPQLLYSKANDIYIKNMTGKRMSIEMEDNLDKNVSKKARVKGTGSDEKGWYFIVGGHGSFTIVDGVKGAITLHVAIGDLNSDQMSGRSRQGTWDQMYTLQERDNGKSFNIEWTSGKRKEIKIVLA